MVAERLVTSSPALFENIVRCSQPHLLISVVCPWQVCEFSPTLHLVTFSLMQATLCFPFYSMLLQLLFSFLLFPVNHLCTTAHLALHLCTTAHLSLGLKCLLACSFSVSLGGLLHGLPAAFTIILEVGQCLLDGSYIPTSLKFFFYLLFYFVFYITPLLFDKLYIYTYISACPQGTSNLISPFYMLGQF